MGISSTCKMLTMARKSSAIFKNGIWQHALVPQSQHQLWQAAFRLIQIYLPAELRHLQEHRAGDSHWAHIPSTMPLPMRATLLVTSHLT